ncbi:MAG: protoglobin domain-containing protein [Chitinophagaceae bacterium]
MQNKRIKGYDYGMVAVSPVSLAELDLLKAAVSFTKEDELHLRKAGAILSDQVNNILDSWYDFIGHQQHLLHYFTEKGQANLNYLTAVRRRIGQWLKDTCFRMYDQEWLNYQHEIALRHHRTKKNQTDNTTAAPIIHYRYMIAFVYPFTATVKPFLAQKGYTAGEVEAMYNAWFKAVLLTVILWTQPYIREGDF